MKTCEKIGGFVVTYYEIKIMRKSSKDKKILWWFWKSKTSVDVKAITDG